MTNRCLLTPAVAWFAVLGSVHGAEALPRTPTSQEIEFIEKRVRPVLAENCWGCHGAKKQMAGLRLDSRAAILRGGDSGPAVVPGQPDASLLLKAVRQVGDLKMPPKGKLKPEAVDALTVWIKGGAQLPQLTTVTPEAGNKHWAFQPVSDPQLPAVKLAAWPRTSIDHFILSRLEEAGLTPSGPADRPTLIRRTTFDLTGLPPSPEEVSAFENDESPDAFARVVDRLLASSHYGERWGRYWLDVARFADTRGYVFLQDTNYPWAYTYRDYVIRAFNDDLPYDKFIVQQLAADKLPLGTDRRPLAAMGFLTIGGRFMNNVQDILDDRIDVVTRGLLGLTVTCARCHDHKFDPIPSKDYYALYGVFASSIEPDVPPLFEPTPRTRAYEAFQKEMAVRHQKLEEFRLAKFHELSTTSRTRAAEYLLAAQHALHQPNPEEFMLLAEGKDLNPTMITRWRAFLSRSKKTHDPVMAPWHTLAGLPEKDFATRAKEQVLRWATQPDPARPVNPLVVWTLATRLPSSLADTAGRYGELLNEVEKIWVAARQSGLDKLPDPAQEQLRQVFDGPDAAPNIKRELVSDLQLLPDRASQAKLQELVKAVEQYRINGPGAPPRAHTLMDAATPYEPRVFLRGNPNQPGAAVPRGMPAVAAGPKCEPFRNGSGRLELAQAIVDRKNPLTARVFVNRVWQHHFGVGLVRTPSDFGLRSEPPSHPQLLDHLATAFMNGGWSVKKLHRLILLSAVYQQRSDDRADCTRLDPENARLWRMNRQRLDFEATRDALLAVSGRLDAKAGGPSVRDILGPAGTRRTLYGFVDRQYTPGLYRVFDFPSPDTTSPQRDVTTIPQQALFLLNSPFVLECARGLLRRTDVSGLSDPAQRIQRLYHLCLGRAAAADELSLGREFTATDSPGTWEQFAQALLETNEFVFLD